ncbi:MAG TPA: hypothetical protein PK760_16255, partial [Flavobacteriales bacterium]|nr:hypothetical protein [Flavobacteriales bacterium]
LLVLFTSSNAQHLTYNEWAARAVKDMRLAPRYGDRKKSAEQLASDAEFIRLMHEKDSVPRSASSTLIAHGFDLLRKGDLPAAMFRFNQAFLVDSTNTDIYWGYGTFFMELDRPTVAHTMFRAGLSQDSTNTHLLIGEATAYLADHHIAAQTDSVAAMEPVRQALAMLQRAERYDAQDSSLLYRMSVCYFLRGECDKARAYFSRAREAKATMDTGYLQHLNERCPPLR